MKKDITVAVLEICLLERALIKVKCDLEIEGNVRKAALRSTNATAILYNFVNSS